MRCDHDPPSQGLKGHALRNAHLRERALKRAEEAPPLAQLIVKIRAEQLGLTRLEFARRSGLSRGTLRDLELGVHTPTRRVLQRFVSYCQSCRVSPSLLEELRCLYAGLEDSLSHVISRLELRAGSPRELARRVGISPTTLWEYRRGNFPIPIELLRRLCQAVDERPDPVERLWYEAERQRLLKRGYPEVLADFWTLCARASCSEKHLLKRGVGTATLRKLRYLEVPAWSEVAAAVKTLCRNESEVANLQQRWQDATNVSTPASVDRFGLHLKQLRKQHGISRRQLADLFGIGGKKPARIIKYIEEDGFYSVQAYPAGLVALLATSEGDQTQLWDSWQKRRHQFHRRHRPEMRVDLRLAREWYGFELSDLQPILGYGSQEYQRIERGMVPLRETACRRILDALHLAGRRRVQSLLAQRCQCEAERASWQSPLSVADLIAKLARREGGLIPLTRILRQAGLKGLWAGRLRAIVQNQETPAWPVLAAIGRVGGVSELTEVQRDWYDRYRLQLEQQCNSPLGVELRLLIAESAATLREFSPQLGFNYSVLIRDLQRIDRDDPVRWFHIERILKPAGVLPDAERWRQIHALWYTASERRKRAPLNPRRNGDAAAHVEKPLQQET